MIECSRCGKPFDPWGLCPDCDYPRMKGKYGMTPMPDHKFARLNK